MPYTDHEASIICDKVKHDSSFLKAVQVIIRWLECGDCSKKNVNLFYSMIQSTNSHVRRLLNEKVQFDEEFQKSKQLLRSRVQAIYTQCKFVSSILLIFRGLFFFKAFGSDLNRSRCFRTKSEIRSELNSSFGNNNIWIHATTRIHSSLGKYFMDSLLLDRFY